MLRPTSTLCAAGARGDRRFGSVVRALADYAVPTQELDVYYCGAPDRSQFLLRIPDRAQTSCHDS